MPTHVKMDTEAAEPEALRARLLGRHQPVARDSQLLSKRAPLADIQSRPIDFTRVPCILTALHRRELGRNLVFDPQTATETRLAATYAKDPDHLDALL